MVAIPQIKEKIVDLLRIKGPSLPIQLSREINISSLFVSAFLSELTDEKKIKVSSLKVGGSPLYFLEGQELQLEKFYNYLHPKEGEAFLLIRENKILKDSDQDPAIRVALRAIRDFSAGFTKNNEIYWRYLQIPESEAYKLIDNKYSTRQVEPEQKQEPKEEKREVIIQEEIKQDEPKQIIEPPKSLEIVPESKQEPTPKKTKTPKTKLPKIIETSVEKEFANPLAKIFSRQDSANSLIIISGLGKGTFGILDIGACMVAFKKSIDRFPQGTNGKIFTIGNEHDGIAKEKQSPA